jgi:hypothetical protein
MAAGISKKHSQEDFELIMVIKPFENLSANHLEEGAGVAFFVYLEYTVI